MERMLKMSAFEVNFYYKADGSCPVRDFLDTLDDKMLAKLLGTISLLEPMAHNCGSLIPNHWEMAFLNCVPSKAATLRASCISS